MYDLNISSFLYTDTNKIAANQRIVMNGWSLDVILTLSLSWMYMKINKNKTKKSYSVNLIYKTTETIDTQVDCKIIRNVLKSVFRSQQRVFDLDLTL